VAGQAPPGSTALHPDLRLLAEHGRDLLQHHHRQAIRRTTFHSVKDLETAIRTDIDGWNERAHPFTLTKNADDIIAHAKPAANCKKTYDPRR